MKILPTYTATIYVGLQEGYNGPTMDPLIIREHLQNYCDEVGLAVTFKFTAFIYTKGWEWGVAVGLINYPRFPKANDFVKAQAVEIAKRLMGLAKQERVTVVCTDETIMLEQSDL